MANQLDRRTLVSWLLDNGFTEATGGRTSHRKFVHDSSRVAITVAGHGPQDITKKQVGMTIRELVRAGFDRDVVREQLLGIKPPANTQPEG